MARNVKSNKKCKQVSKKDKYHLDRVVGECETCFYEVFDWQEHGMKECVQAMVEAAQYELSEVKTQINDLVILLNDLSQGLETGPKVILNSKNRK